MLQTVAGAPHPPVSQLVIVIAPEDDMWRVQLNGEAVTVHATESEATRSAAILAERLRRSGAQDVELTVCGAG